MIRARTSPRVPIGLVVLSLLATLSTALAPPARAAGCDVVVRDARALHRAAEHRASGTVICVRGTIRIGRAIEPRDRLIFAGPGAIVAQGHVEEGFDLDKAAGIVIRGLDMSGFSLRAIRCGRNARILRNHLHHNGRNGIGGGHCAGLLIKRNEINRNGGREHIGMGSAGVKLAGDADGTRVIGNEVHHNIGNGLWWDVDATHALAARNRVVGNTRKGIHYEVSSGPAVFRYNVVRHNNSSGHKNSAGIMVEGSQRVRIYGNVLGGNRNGGILVQSGRGFQLRDVWVYRNRLRGDDVRCQDGENINCQR